MLLIYSFSFVAFYNRFENYLPELIQMTDKEKDLLAKELGTISMKEKNICMVLF